MEIEGDDGSIIEVKYDGSKAVFGRDLLGFYTKDRTVSRRHVLFKVEDQTEPRVSFQVIGKNPVWVRRSDEDEGEVRVFSRSEKGEVAAGDWFCISSQKPVWFNLKRIGIAQEKELESIDVSLMDPVKEFGFLVIGHEFDSYPKQRIKDARNWDWFLEEHATDSDDDDESFEDNKKKKAKGKRKKGRDNEEDDDDWTESEEEDKETVAKVKKIKESKYSTRSKDKGRDINKAAMKKKSSMSSSVDNDEDDETLISGFIVDDDNEHEVVESDDEEEELMDDEDEELDD